MSHSASPSPQYEQLTLPLPGFEFQAESPVCKTDTMPQRKQSPAAQLTLRLDVASPS